MYYIHNIYAYKLSNDKCEKTAIEINTIITTPIPKKLECNDVEV